MLDSVVETRRTTAGVAAAVLVRASSLRLTGAVLAALLGATAVLDARPSLANAVAGWTSTNIANLEDHPVAAMLASMFVTPGHPWRELALLALACGIVERRFGLGRTVAIALAGQVIATVITEYGAALLAGTRLIAASSPDRSDVGVSYAMFALLGAAVLVQSTWWRRALIALLVGDVVVPLAADPNMTNAGHVLSVGCGVAACAVLGARGRRGPVRDGVQESQT